MARKLPVFQPNLYPEPLKPGVVYSDGEYPGRSGATSLPPESPQRAAKGDLGESNIPGFAVKNPMPYRLSTPKKK